MCGKLFQTVDSLQLHLLSNHGLQSEAVLQLVKKQEETISEMQSLIKKISSSQLDILDEIKDMKSTLMKGHLSVAPPPAPYVPVPAPQPACPPVQPQASSYAAAAQAQVTQLREQEQEYCQSLPGYRMSPTR